MSDVSNVILSFDILEDEDARIDEVNKILGEVDPREQQFVDIDKDAGAWYGGTKVLETPLYIGAFNHFPEAELLERLRNLPWRHPENVQLIIQRQHEERFSIVLLPPA